MVTTEQCGWYRCKKSTMPGLAFCRDHSWKTRPNNLEAPAWWRVGIASTRRRLVSIYAISGGGLVKIGMAIDVKKRLSHLQIGSPVPIELLGHAPGAEPALEKVIHDFLVAHRAHGEWFRQAPEVMEIVKLICDGDARLLKFHVTAPLPVSSPEL